MPPGGYRRVAAPHAAALLGACAERIDARGLIEVIEGWFGGRPEELIRCPALVDRQMSVPAGAARPKVESARRSRPSQDFIDTIRRALEDARKPMSQKELAKATPYKVSTIGQGAAKMIKLGLLSRTPSGYTLVGMTETASR